MKVVQTTIEVTWALPTCSGNLRQIRVEYKKEGEANWQSKIVKSSDTKMTLTGLAKDAEYDVRVVTVDLNGQEHVVASPKIPKPGWSPPKLLIL